MHNPTDRITHTTAFVTPVVEHWLERAESEFYIKRSLPSLAGLAFRIQSVRCRTKSKKKSPSGTEITGNKQVKIITTTSPTTSPSTSTSPTTAPTTSPTTSPHPPTTTKSPTAAPTTSPTTTSSTAAPHSPTVT